MSIESFIGGAAFALIATSTTMAGQSLTAEDHEIGGRSTTSIIASLAERNIHAVNVEEWGRLIRVETIDAAGANQIVFVDKDTLRPLGETSAVATELSVSLPSSMPTRRHSDSTPRSLVETDD